MQNVFSSIIKIDQNDLDSHIHSDRLKKYEIIRLTGDQANIYRYEDCLHNQRGVLTPIQKNNDLYIFKVYKYGSFSNSTEEYSVGDRTNFIGVFRGFLYQNGYKESISYGGLPI